MSSLTSATRREHAISDNESYIKGSSSKQIGSVDSHGFRKPSYSSVQEDATVPQSFSEISAADIRAISKELRRHDGDCAECLRNAERRLKSQYPDDTQKFDSLFQLFLDQFSNERRENQTASRQGSIGGNRGQRSSLELVNERKASTRKLDTLPQEILENIFGYLGIRTVLDQSLPCRSDLLPCLLASKRFYTAALSALYRQITIPQSKTFSRLTQTLADNEDLARLIRRLDFSHYSNMGYGRSRAQSANIKYITSQTISSCLASTTDLEEFLVHHHLSDELSEDVLQRLFSMRALKALDFCACSSENFTTAFRRSIIADLPLYRMTGASSLSRLKRLSLHECSTLPQSIFTILLPQLDSITHLDLAHTLVDDDALLSLPRSARLTHLNLERCTRLTGEAVTTFLTTHPAASRDLVYLNMLSDPTRHRLLSADDVSAVLPALPPALKSLNLGGAMVLPEHISLLHPHVGHLEELGLRSAKLSMADIRVLFESNHEDPDQKSFVHSSLRYIDLTDVASVTCFSLLHHPEGLTDKTTKPLQVIEVGESILEQLKKRKSAEKNWTLKEFGRRGWYVKQPTSSDPESLDDGYRSWKMGAKWWGMRKVPVAEQDVGGQYGYYMFKRA